MTLTWWILSGTVFLVVLYFCTLLCVIIRLMINRVAKGNRLELKAKKILEIAGYCVERPKRTRFNSIDFFDKFDLIAVNKNGWRLIQVKAGYLSTIDREQIELFEVPANTTKEFWRFVDRVKEPIIQYIK